MTTKTLSLSLPPTNGLTFANSGVIGHSASTTISQLPAITPAPAPAPKPTLAPTIGQVRANAPLRSEHGWLLVPPAAWTAPLTVAQKAQIPVGQDNIVITEDGEVWARLARKNACWVNAANECRKPEARGEAYDSWQSFPKNFTDAAGGVTQVKVGVLAYDTGHAPKGHLSWEKVVQHYLGELKAGRAGRWTQRALDDPTTALAMGRIHIDPEADGSIWFHGAIAPHRSIVEVVLASSAGISGEWMRRSSAANYRSLAGICVVNTPAYRSAFTDRLAASVSAPTDDDRFTTFGEGWANSLDELIGALPEDQLPTYLDRVAAAVELAPDSSLSARWMPAEAPEANLEAPAEEAAADETPVLEVEDLDGSENVDENGDPLSVAEIAARMGRKAQKALAESVDWRAATSAPVAPPDSFDFEIFAMAEGVRSRDGRLIMKGALEMPFSPQPILWEEDGLSHDNQQVVGWGWQMERRPRGDGGIDCVVKCSWARDANTGELLELAAKLSAMKPKAGTDVLGLRVSIDGGAYEASVVWDEVNHPRLQPVVDNGEYLGAYSFPYYVFSRLEIGAISFVGVPAIAQTAVREIASLELEAFVDDSIDRVAASIDMGGMSLKLARTMAADLRDSKTPLRWVTGDVRSMRAARFLSVLSRISA